MSTTTTRNLLVKPGYADAADIAVINTNYDSIDASFAKCNWAAAVAPTTGDDFATDGYSIGSFWFDTTAHKLYIAETVGTGTATWRLIDSAGAAYSTPYQMTSTLAIGTSPFAVTSTTVNTNLNADTVDGIHATTILQAGGTIPLTADWDVGAYHITADHFVSDVAIGTAPYQTTSTTVNTNLNADLLDGVEGSGYVTQALADAKGDLIVGSAANTWARQAVGASDGMVLTVDASATNGVAWSNDSVLTGASRQILLNGEFTINQTGISQYTDATTAVNSDDTYLLDQWILLSDGNNIMDVWQASVTRPTGYKNSILLETETANKKAGIVQIVESNNCRHAIGNTVSLRFYAYTPAANPNANIMAGIISWNSTADGVTSDVVSAWEATNTAPTLAANWTYENVPARLALVNDTWTEYKIENISIDTASTTNIGVFIWLDDTDSTVDDKLYITGVQLNIGATCAPWSSTHYTAELLLCQRYFFVVNSIAGNYPHLGTCQANSTSQGYVEVQHPTELLGTTPPMTLYPNTAAWVVSAAAIDTYANEGDKKQMTYRFTMTGTPFSQYHAYLAYGNNDTTCRMYLASRL